LATRYKSAKPFLLPKRFYGALMEELESPVEKLQETLHERAEHASALWMRWSALLSALFAVLAAIAGLQSAHFANDAMLEQIAASDKWAYYQAKGIKASLAEMQGQMLVQLGSKASNDAAPEVEKKLERYRQEQQEINREANQKAEESQQHLKQHETLAYAVTLYQIAIAMIAIAVLTTRRRFLLFSGFLGVAGLFFLVKGLLV